MRTLMAALLVLGATGVVDAIVIEPKTSPTGIRWVTGGIGVEERDAIASLEDGFTLKIIAAAKRHTAYAADVSFAIRDASGSTVLDGQAEGPWTLIRLSPGAYTVEVTSRGETQRQQVTITEGPRKQVAFYFDRANF